MLKQNDFKEQNLTPISILLFVYIWAGPDSGLLVEATKKLEFDFSSKNTQFFASEILNGFDFNQFFKF